MIKGELNEIETEDIIITRNKYTQKVTTEERKKRYRFVFDKRHVVKDTLVSYPYGY